MAFFSDLEAHAATLRALIGDDPRAVDLPARVAALDDDAIVATIAEASAVVRAAESLRIAATGVVAARSSRAAGHSGLSQVRGHRSPVSLVQEITGASRTDAVKQVRLGEAMWAAVPTADDADAPDQADTAPVARPWHAPLSQALLGDRITAAQHDAILRNLGEPPTIDADDTAAAAAGADDGTDADDAADAAGAERRRLVDAAREEARAAWETAACQLIDEAGCRTVEDLAAQARAIRDILDPEGAQRRFEHRYARRSFRTWRDADGVLHGSFIFDDEGALWVQTIHDHALAPRRGVRFVDDTTRAEQLADDPRTTDQLAYDLMIDVLRAGALAEPEAVFGTRQAGIRLLITQDAVHAAERGEPATGSAQDDCAPVPATLALQHACDTGISECLIDAAGNPLDLGREARLFTAKQKLTLAIRDGGCRWPGCDRPAHYCESHHIDAWAAGGRTDVDRGILLCRFHHMQLHHGGWTITRHRKDDFVLHPPGRAAPILLTTRLARRYQWRSSPPPPRFLPTAVA
ncbi:HNH endonuclease signature motif containing protein [Microbacterium elymi]|uniref:HNH endonuclease n=1 Tax=Microbacterium elymi TaxID=2909587 RepID=A0ABY5NIR8_9MICO|nr:MULTISPECIES: HNH endonuclease signature motif containing protein [Microbacterium]UUT35065.1 HNH endonuclease [Microbacterium elymi]